MASIDAWRNDKWRARWRDPDGRSRSQVFDRKIDASNHLKAIEGDKVRGHYIDPDAGRQTFESFADEWAAAQDWKQTSRDAWGAHRRRLVARVGSKSLASIDRLVLQSVQRDLSATYARSTTITTMAYARMILRAAHVAGRIGRDPTVGLRNPRAGVGDTNGRVSPNEVPTREEAISLLEAAPAPYRAAIALGIAGLRVGEVLGMCGDRIDLASARVVVDQQLQTMAGVLGLTTPKREKTRTIVVPAVVATELRRHLRDHEAEGLLFRGLRGAPMLRRDQFYASAWRPALRGAGLSADRFKFHSLRHFCASTLLAEGAPLSAVAGHLGDTVETVSRTYVHWLRDDRNVPAAVLDRVLAPTPAEAATI
ncbi:MAG TPA: site-specific integrase [Acidimicrobiales bacterium]|nr:site-specific integrase [Acidimicrobiales bacterium]